MTVYGQRLHRLEITKLKNIKKLCISFEDKNITGILGPNGSGKSTILHALACCFKPLSEEQKDYKFSNFFLPSPDDLWQGSELKIVHTYGQSSQMHNNIEKSYKKSSDRWRPQYKKRPVRNVYYFGIDICVPLIEAEKRKVKINYSTSSVSENLIEDILQKASFCLNKRYISYNIHTTRDGRNFIGVESEEIKYSALSMSAGEQKLFILLEKVFRAPKYSLVLIDELDLLLHDLAIKNLIEVIAERAESKSLQVIFTTHRESILDMSDLINIRHIVTTPEKTLCFNDTKPDAINRLTGVQRRSIEIFVEDDLAAAVIQKVAGQLNIARHVSVQRYGAAINCFTVLAGLRLCGERCEKSIFVLDGDVYRTKEEQEKKLKAVLTGNDEHAIFLRSSSLEKIKCLQLPESVTPEEYIHKMIINNSEENNNSEFQEIIKIAKQIQYVNDCHQYIDQIINRLGYSRDAGLSKIIDLVSSTQDWENYVAEVKDWLTSQVPLLEETSADQSEHLTAADR